MIAIRRAVDLLRPWLGAAFVDAHGDLIRRAVIKMNGFTPGRDDFARLQQELDTMLFMAVRNHTAGRMTLTMDNGQSVRLRLNDFALMADELMYLLYEKLAADPASFGHIQAYSMRTSSLSSLRALYLLFQDVQTPDELATIRRIIKTCHLPFRWRGWLE